MIKKSTPYCRDRGKTVHIKECFQCPYQKSCKEFAECLKEGGDSI